MTAQSSKTKHATSVTNEFHEFFIDQLKDIYWAEKELEKGLKKMAQAATNEKLRSAFETHREESIRQRELLETIFEQMGEKAEGKRCEAMAGLLTEAEAIIADTEKHSSIRDTGLILAAQKVEHYEIASYGTLHALADYLPEKKEVKGLLEKILEGEKKCDVALSILAEAGINLAASKE